MSGRNTVVAAVCCEYEALLPEGPDGHTHGIDCGGYDPRPRFRCCNARRVDGHHDRCRAREHAAAGAAQTARGDADARVPPAPPPPALHTVRQPRVSTGG